MVKYRSRAYYKEIKKIPNVKIIKPTIDVFEIIQKAKLITTITGNTGLSAVFLKKPVITFGQTYYNELSFVKKSLAFEDLPYLVKEQLENFKYNEDELLNFLAKIFESSAKISLSDIWIEERDPQKQKKALEPLAELIAKKLNLKPVGNNQ